MTTYGQNVAKIFRKACTRILSNLTATLNSCQFRTADCKECKYHQFSAGHVRVNVSLSACVLGEQ